MGLEARIWASRLGFGPQGLDLDLEAWIWVSRLGFRPQGRDLGLEAKSGGRGGTKKKEKEKEKEKEEKFLLCESIGHRPLRGRCPTSHPRIAHGQRYPMPCLELLAEEVE